MRKKSPGREFHPWLGVFETVWVQGGCPLFFAEHWRAFCRAAQALGLPRPAKITDAPFRRPRRTGRWRWIHSREKTGTAFSEEKQSPARNFSLALACQRLGSENWDARHKTLSYLTHHQARLASRADEVVLLNEKGEIASGAMSNLFWVSRGRLYTPAPECGCREGVIRAYVLRSRPVTIGAFKIGVLDRADEIFVTNSRLGIQPVTRWNRRRLGRGPVARSLMDDYREAVRAQCL